MKFISLPDDASPRLKAMQFAQLSIIILTMVATFLAAILPQKHKDFTFGLLYSLIFTSITTGFFIRKEQLAAAQNALTKDKYTKYQLFKIISAFGVYFVGFIVSMIFVHPASDPHGPNEQGFWLGGVKVNRGQGCILWLHVFNWLFLWASLFYSCCMTGKRQGPIALTGEEADICIDGTADDEEIARTLQAEDRNWQA
ncbi:hypothetical protein GQ44DRAFT_618221 [Phaeosphaeriaceae sp. PMI808]|nr:hypothetical protein GQ44DRAFT_618221 [Phaeosphaeriaceae sp. PMI808]